MYTTTCQWNNDQLSAPVGMFQQTNFVAQFRMTTVVHIWNHAVELQRRVSTRKSTTFQLDKQLHRCKRNAYITETDNQTAANDSNDRQLLSLSFCSNVCVWAVTPTSKASRDSLTTTRGWNPSKSLGQNAISFSFFLLQCMVWAVTPHCFIGYVWYVFVMLMLSFFLNAIPFFCQI